MAAQDFYTSEKPADKGAGDVLDYDYPSLCLPGAAALVATRAAFFRQISCALGQRQFRHARPKAGRWTFVQDRWVSCSESQSTRYRVADLMGAARASLLKMRRSVLSATLSLIWVFSGVFNNARCRSVRAVRSRVSEKFQN